MLIICSMTQNQQRAKILTATAEVKKRAQRDMEIELSIQRKEARKQAHVDNTLNVQLAVIEKLCKAADTEPIEENLRECSIENFCSLRKNELHAFILDRHPTFTKISELNHLHHPSAKRALADANNGIANAASVAFALRESPSRVFARSVADDTTNDNEDNSTRTDDTPSSLLIVDVLLRPELHGVVKPSDVLLDSAKVQFIRDTFDPNHNMPSPDSFSPTSEILQQADCLFTHLKARLRTHIKTRVMPDQWNNKCLRWAQKNLAIVAAYMVIFDHVVPDVTCLDESSCLLKQPSCNNFLTCSNEESTQVGCYLHFNRNLSVWVRSGSAAGVGGFGQRLSQHKKRAEADTNPDNSQFYDNYPSVESVRSRSKSKRGLFEHLDPYIGASFCKNIPPGILSSRGEDGLFLYTPEEVGWINNLHCHGKPMDQKYQQMIAYLFELGYDLAISRIYNVSNSPGFEGCGLIHHKN